MSKKRVRPIAPVDHLRPHQQEAVYAIQVHLRDRKSTLIAMAPGVGKTHIFFGWLRQVMKLDRRARAIVLVNRRQLAHQAVARVAKFFPTLHPAGLVMADRRDVDARVIVATVQSLSSGGRLDEILAYGAINFLVTDEPFVPKPPPPMEVAPEFARDLARKIYPDMEEAT